MKTSKLQPSRLTRHHRLSNTLQDASDKHLLTQLHPSQIVNQGHGEMALVNGTQTHKAFVKLIPLTELEMLTQNRFSTRNIFQLPNYYQYRIGSCGFGSWRELAIYEQTNNYVLSNTNPNFPLLHHWRILPIVPFHFDDKLNLSVWKNEPNISQRVSAIKNATHSIVLYLEYFPFTLTQWLKAQLAIETDPAGFILKLEKSLVKLLLFIRSQGWLHMDSHFDNIMTDGEFFYLGDYGLTVSNTFQLDSDELEFFKGHPSFDLCTAINSLVHAVVTHYNPSSDWRQTLRGIKDGHKDTEKHFPDAVLSFLLPRVSLALKTGDFYSQLIDDLSTKYPEVELQHILNKLKLSSLIQQMTQ